MKTAIIAQLLAFMLAISSGILPNQTSLIPEQPIPLASASKLTVYFIDVGQADSALVVCDGATMLIDGGNVGDSNVMYSFLDKHSVAHLDYVVATHAHEDHVGGLSGALNYATVGTVYSPVKTYDSRAFTNFIGNVEKQEVLVTTPVAGGSFTLGGATVDIFAPVKNYDEPNNTSIVLKVTHGKVSFLFTGDAEREAEQDILAMGFDLSATVLKVGHHGSETSTSYAFLREVMPEYAVISCGTNNSYGHPHESVLSRLRDAEVKLYRTDMQGDITFVSNGATISIATQRNAGVQTNSSTSSSAIDKPTTNTSSPTGDTNYIGNKNSLKFHIASCRSLPLESNRVYFANRDIAVSAGYTPCGICHP